MLELSCLVLLTGSGSCAGAVLCAWTIGGHCFRGGDDRDGGHAKEGCARTGGGGGGAGAGHWSRPSRGFIVVAILGQRRRVCAHCAGSGRVANGGMAAGRRTGKISLSPGMRFVWVQYALHQGCSALQSGDWTRAVIGHRTRCANIPTRPPRNWTTLVLSGRGFSSACTSLIHPTHQYCPCRYSCRRHLGDVAFNLRDVAEFSQDEVDESKLAPNTALRGGSQVGADSSR